VPRSAEQGAAVTCGSCRWAVERKGHMSESIWLVCEECAAAEPMPVRPDSSCPAFEPALKAEKK